MSLLQPSGTAAHENDHTAGGSDEIDSLLSRDAVPNLQDVTVSDALLASSDGEAGSGIGFQGDVKVKEIVVPNDHRGALRIKYDYRAEYGTSVNFIIKQNGTNKGTQKTSTSGTYANWSEDLSGWTIGDTIELWVIGDNADNDQGEVRNFRIYGDTSSASTW